MTVEFIFLRFTVTFGVGLELTAVLLGQPLDVLFVLPVVAVGNGELPVEPEPEPDPGVAPQATSMKVNAMTSETAGKRDLRFSICSVRIRVTPSVFLGFLRYTNQLMRLMSTCSI